MAGKKKQPKKVPKTLAVRPTELIAQTGNGFDEVVALIDAARTRAVAVINTTLIDLYWSIGEYISRKITQEGWGQGTTGGQIVAAVNE